MRCKYEFLPGEVTRQDIPRPKQTELSEVEKKIIDQVKNGPPIPIFVEDEPCDEDRAAPPAKPPLGGKWLPSLDGLHADAGAGEQAVGDAGRDFAIPDVVEVDINYPLTTAVRLRIKPYDLRISSPNCETNQVRKFDEGYFLWTVAQEYLRIYAEDKKYGVWGHAMSDLVFEGVEIDNEGRWTLLIGS